MKEPHPISMKLIKSRPAWYSGEQTIVWITSPLSSGPAPRRRITGACERGAMLYLQTYLAIPRRKWVISLPWIKLILINPFFLFNIHAWITDTYPANLGALNKHYPKVYGRLQYEKDSLDHLVRICRTLWAWKAIKLGSGVWRHATSTRLILDNPRQLKVSWSKNDTYL